MDINLREQLKHELLCEYKCNDMKKDILIVVKDQLFYIQECIDSIFSNTSNFNLYLWDNSSEKDTQEYLESLSAQDNVFLYRSSENLGFIKPNNSLASASQSPYMILLNSDTKVSMGWDIAMIGYLQSHTEVAGVGYMGGLLDEAGRGIGIAYGDQIDYLMGWCLAMSRKTYEEYGLFDDQNLQFAYFEDADWSLRIKKAGYNLHALRLNYVWHAGNQTVKKVAIEQDLTTTFDRNGQFFRHKWAGYLGKQRVLQSKSPTMGNRAIL